MLDVKTLYNPKYAKSFRRGVPIERAGDRSGGMYIILAGEVGVYKSYGTKNETLVATEKPGGFFGEAGLFFGREQPFSFVAVTEVIVLELNHKNIHEFLGSNTQAVFEMMKGMCVRSDALNKEGAYIGAAIEQEPEPAPPPPLQESAPPPTEIKAEPVQPAKTAAPEPTKKPDADVNSKTVIKRPPGALLPDGHGDYKLPFAGCDDEFVFEKSLVCPMCKKSFKTRAVKSYRLMTERTDDDMRVRYKGVEPMYYDVSTCPSCLYSALTEMFVNGAKSKEFIAAKTDKYKAEYEAALSAENADAVFVKYYLALICAPMCFKNPQLCEAKLWLKMSRLYADCEDEAMELLAAKNAHEAYMYSYENLSIPTSQNQQLCTMIGETALKLGNYKLAKDFFFKAKIDKSGAVLLKDHADDRINDLRQILDRGAETQIEEEAGAPV